jgi:hypothetical protein
MNAKVASDYIKGMKIQVSSVEVSLQLKSNQELLTDATFLEDFPSKLKAIVLYVANQQIKVQEWKEAHLTLGSIWNLFANAKSSNEAKQIALCKSKTKYTHR